MGKSTRLVGQSVIWLVGWLINNLLLCGHTFYTGYMVSIYLSLIRVHDEIICTVKGGRVCNLSLPWCKQTFLVHQSWVALYRIKKVWVPFHIALCPDYFSPSGKIVWWTAYTVLVPVFRNYRCDITSTGFWIQKRSSELWTPRQPTCAPFDRYNSLVNRRKLGLPDQCPFH